MKFPQVYRSLLSVGLITLMFLAALFSSSGAVRGVDFHRFSQATAYWSQGSWDVGGLLDYAHTDSGWANAENTGIHLSDSGHMGANAAWVTSWPNTNNIASLNLAGDDFILDTENRLLWISVDSLNWNGEHLVGYFRLYVTDQTGFGNGDTRAQDYRDDQARIQGALGAASIWTPLTDYVDFTAKNGSVLQVNANGEIKNLTDPPRGQDSTSSWRPSPKGWIPSPV